MNEKRLMLMRTMLREVMAGTWEPTGGGVQETPVTFDMGVWVHETVSSQETDCGFSACAIGHACLDERFISQGLRFQRTDSGRPVAPQYEKHTCWDAVSRFFGISTPEAMFLFNAANYREEHDHLDSGGLDIEYEDDYVSPERVCNRISLLLATGTYETRA